MERRDGSASRPSQPTWRFAFGLVRQESNIHLRMLIALALLLVLFSSSLAALSPLLLKFIVDHLTSPGVLSGVAVAIGILAVAYAGSNWLTRVLAELRLFVLGRVDQRLHRRLSLRLFKHVMALPLRFHLDRKTGALSQTLTNGLLGFSTIVQQLVVSILPVIIELSIMGTVLLTLGQPIFLGIIGATLLCYAFAFWLGVTKLLKPARAVSTAHIDANAVLTDSILNYETIKSFSAEPRIHERMEDNFAKTETKWAQFFTQRALNGVLIGTIFSVSLGTSVFLASNAVQQGRMSLGDFVLVNAYMLQVFRPMEALGYAFRDIAQGMAFIEKMNYLFQQEQEPSVRSGSDILPPGPGELVFDDVSLSYHPNRAVLEGVCFRVPAGRTVAIVGASGAGKSSLIRLLVRFWEPDNGNILLDGVPITNVSAASVRDVIAVVPQDTVLFNDTIAYNIAIGRAGSSMADIMDAARLASIHSFIVSQPDGYQTRVGERGLKLSGGEKQRIAIARAALKKPRVFVFDEATSSLDTKTEQLILQNLARVSTGTTTLVIAHRLSTIVDADEILVLDKGKIVERGTHKNLLEDRGAYHGMWIAQRDDVSSVFGQAI